MIEIPLDKSQSTIIDEIDVDLFVNKWRVHNTRSGYYVERSIKHPYRKGKQAHEYLARVILERKLGRPLEKHERADHINGDTLNNTRANLRVANNMQNRHNSKKPNTNKSGYKGVCRYKLNGKWVARITANKKRVFLGYFDTPEEAHAAYCEAAKELCQEFARLE